MSISWQEALEGFLFWKQVQGVSQTALNDYQIHTNRFFKRFPDCWQSQRFKPSVLQYMADEHKPASFNLRLIYLRVFFQYCVDEGYLQDNPLKGIKQRKAQPRIVDIEIENLQKLLSLPNQRTFAGLRDYALLLFELDTGTCPSEALFSPTRISA